MEQRIKTAISEIFGFRTFRPHQEGIVRAILDGKDVFAVMPTGGGKSLCYQLPAYLMEGVCVVVSPLISLMKDQVDAANANGLIAGALNSATAIDQRANIGIALRQGEMDLLYVSPERFNTEFFIERLKTLKIAFFAIDEAHCISEWGHDFRPDYLALSQISDHFPDVPIAAFTATATSQVARDIETRLKLRSPHLVRASFNRPNLFYQVWPKENPNRQILEFLKEHSKESGIIYRLSRKSVDQTAEMLQEHGFSAKPYHAGMSDRDRAQTQEEFRRDETPIIVATIAFGMGIDKSNVRFVAHVDLPKNIEGYYQETGRSGRDGEPAHCLLLYSSSDYAKLLRFVEETEDEKARETGRLQLRQMMQYAEHDGCRRAAILLYFGETFPNENCCGCDICAGNAEREDATISAQKALSAMIRTKERFGAGHLIDVLTGSVNDRIIQHQHNTLPTYGVGKDQTKVYWRRLFNSLLAQGLTRVDDLQYPIPKVTGEGWKVLRAERTFQQIRQAKTKKEKEEKKRKIETALSDSGKPAPYDERLFDRLRELRTTIARADNVPPYIIFSDKTLHEMSRVFPETTTEMLEISGVGRRKMDAYGDQFLDAIADYRGKKK